MGEARLALYARMVDSLHGDMLLRGMVRNSAVGAPSFRQTWAQNDLRLGNGCIDYSHDLYDDYEKHLYHADFYLYYGRALHDKD